MARASIPASVLPRLISRPRFWPARTLPARLSPVLSLPLFLFVFRACGLRSNVLLSRRPFSLPSVFFCLEAQQKKPGPTPLIGARVPTLRESKRPRAIRRPLGPHKRDRCGSKMAREMSLRFPFPPYSPGRGGFARLLH